MNELRKIRESLEPKPSPPPQKPRGFIDEFTQFLNKYSIAGLALAFIMGGAVNKLVSALVTTIIMPLITFFIPEGGWREVTLNLGPIQLGLGAFTGAVIDFVVIALIIFLTIKQLNKAGLQ